MPDQSGGMGLKAVFHLPLPSPARQPYLFRPIEITEARWFTHVCGEGPRPVRPHLTRVRSHQRPRQHPDGGVRTFGNVAGRAKTARRMPRKRNCVRALKAEPSPPVPPSLAIGEQCPEKSALTLGRRYSGRELQLRRLGRGTLRPSSQRLERALPFQETLVV